MGSSNTNAENHFHKQSHNMQSPREGQSNLSKRVRKALDLAPEHLSCIDKNLILKTPKVIVHKNPVPFLPIFRQRAGGTHRPHSPMQKTKVKTFCFHGKKGSQFICVNPKGSPQALMTCFWWQYYIHNLKFGALHSPCHDRQSPVLWDFFFPMRNSIINNTMSRSKA